MRGRFTQALCFGVVFALGNLCAAGPANLYIDTFAPDRFIRGATIPLLLDVYNQAPFGSDPLNYNYRYAFPNGTLSATFSGPGPIAADGGAMGVRSTNYFSTAGWPLGAQDITVGVTGQEGTLNSPAEKTATVQVLQHVVPSMWIRGVERRMSSVPEPQVDPEQFGATGGGESAAVAAPNILAGTQSPTANMDLDAIVETGSPQITTSLVPTYNIIAGDSPSMGLPWQIIIETRAPGHFEKLITLYFSDEDIPGAVDPDSVVARLLINADVVGQNVTGTLAIVPEPGVLPLIAWTWPLLGRRRARA